MRKTLGEHEIACSGKRAIRFNKSTDSSDAATFLPDLLLELSAFREGVSMIRSTASVWRWEPADYDLKKLNAGFAPAPSPTARCSGLGETHPRLISSALDANYFRRRLRHPARFGGCGRIAAKVWQPLDEKRARDPL